MDPPRQEVSSQPQLWELPRLLQPGSSLCLRFTGVDIGRELEPVVEVEVMGHADHIVQGGDARGEQEVIVRISICTCIDTIDGAARAALLKETEELTSVKAIGVAGQDLPLTNSIANCETGGQLILLNW